MWCVSRETVDEVSVLGAILIPIPFRDHVCPPPNGLPAGRGVLLCTPSEGFSDPTRPAPSPSSYGRAHTSRCSPAGSVSTAYRPRTAVPERGLSPIAQQVRRMGRCGRSPDRVPCVPVGVRRRIRLHHRPSVEHGDLLRAAVRSCRCDAYVPSARSTGHGPCACDRSHRLSNLDRQSESLRRLPSLSYGVGSSGLRTASFDWSAFRRPHKCSSWLHPTVIAERH